MKLKRYLLATVHKFPPFSWQNTLKYLIMRVSQMKTKEVWKKLRRKCVQQ